MYLRICDRKRIITLITLDAASGERRAACGVDVRRRCAYLRYSNFSCWKDHLRKNKRYTYIIAQCIRYRSAHNENSSTAALTSLPSIFDRSKNNVLACGCNDGSVCQSFGSRSLICWRLSASGVTRPWAWASASASSAFCTVHRWLPSRLKSNKIINQSQQCRYTCDSAWYHNQLLINHKCSRYYVVVNVSSLIISYTAANERSGHWLITVTHNLRTENRQQWQLLLLPIDEFDEIRKSAALITHMNHGVRVRWKIILFSSLR